jgi:hypothetical protein
MKLIIIPSKVNYNEYSLRYKIRKILSSLNLVKPPKFNLNGEFNHYGELTSILSPDNVIVPVKLKKIYFDNNIQKYKDNALIENYPSNFNFIEPTFKSVNYIKKNICEFDALLFSLQADKKFTSLINVAKENGLKVVFFDKKDHNKLYFDQNEDIFRGFSNYKPDLYLKQDIPFSNRDKGIVPTCPIPCNPVKKSDFISNKKFTFSFIGDFKDGVTLPDRKLILDFLQNNFKDTYIKYSSDKSHFHSFDAMNKIYNNTRILVSPSGIVWDSYRHADFIRYNSPILIPKPNTKTAPGDFIDMENCIMYDVEYKSINKAILLNEKELLEKLNFVLSNNEFQKKLRDSYFELILNHHTRRKRSEYILSLIDNIN